MKKLITILFTILSLLIVLSAYQQKKLSNGAPPSFTGAPNENTCAKSGCHDDHFINQGIGKLSLQIGNNISNYEPGKKYLVSINLNQNNTDRFGFQTVALDEQNQSVGNIKLIDSIRTQLLSGKKDFSNREYVTYQYLGTDPYSKNTGRWSFYWTAPLERKNITFYTATVAANNDGTDKGDQVYTQQLTLTPLP